MGGTSIFFLATGAAGDAFAAASALVIGPGLAPCRPAVKILAVSLGAANPLASFAAIGLVAAGLVIGFSATGLAVGFAAAGFATEAGCPVPGFVRAAAKMSAMLIPLPPAGAFAPVEATGPGAAADDPSS